MVLDTNVLVSVLINPGGLPDQVLQRWESDEFTLVTSAAQLDELQRVLGYEKLRRFIRPEQATRLVTSHIGWVRRGAGTHRECELVRMMGYPRADDPSYGSHRFCN